MTFLQLLEGFRAAFENYNVPRWCAVPSACLTCVLICGLFSSLPCSRPPPQTPL